MTDGSRIGIPDEGVLPGDEKTAYVRASVLRVLLIAPVTGLLYMLALPVIVLVQAAAIAGERIFGKIFDFLKAVAVFEWAPNETQFSGKRRTLRAKSKPGEMKATVKKGGKDVYLI